MIEIKAVYWVSPSFHPTYKCWVKPNLPRAIAYLSRLGGGNGTQHHHLSVILGFTEFHPTYQERSLI
ncbi:hypothetical protein AAEJ74_25390 [Limnospira fusiformis PMC 851.14]|uniref:Uncharacterized protein n=1 Tax=Limnospira fusiformis PMC 851.14 TaxID=2219512 RepID=A0ABU9ETZ0_LIMFS